MNSQHEWFFLFKILKILIGLLRGMQIGARCWIHVNGMYLQSFPVWRSVGRRLSLLLPTNSASGFTSLIQCTICFIQHPTSNRYSQIAPSPIRESTALHPELKLHLFCHHHLLQHCPNTRLTSKILSVSVNYKIQYSEHCKKYDQNSFCRRRRRSLRPLPR